MIFILISFGVPLLLYFFLPSVLQIATGKSPVSKIWLVIACLLFIVSWYLPSPEIRGQQTAFVTHFVGGGLFSGALWLYIRKFLRLDQNPIYDLLAIYFLVSALGVANELFEFVTVEIGYARLNPSDTWWDLLANTSGAVVFWMAYSIYKIFNK